ncbi:MAG: hypothetical protein MUO26_09030 [Methanotrichaceae archaeon]|nr:hypothetical protein [Methanotrichaceae archaeon]
MVLSIPGFCLTDPIVLTFRDLRFYLSQATYSGILSWLHRRFTELEISRGFTTFQLTTILEEAHPIIA